MRVLVLLTLLVVKLHLARCQGLGAGGPSTFGYDASSACSKPYSRDARARFANLPCDFRQQNWCTIAGNAYPCMSVRDHNSGQSHRTPRS
ncbi:protein spaetzle 4-like [Belonocnema kinseyi]|uniref:protein spaetzle 4-like n=1 Tax=Belonocnema kinseyi TaxID=2817044 RepID=UPI00143CDA0D|nr:protein spaetzle 4-like [Belonocnema kinseyi]